MSKYITFLILFLKTSFWIQAQNKPFVTKWKIKDEREPIYFQLSKGFDIKDYQITIDWGDGTKNKNQFTHLYHKPGTYEVKVLGTFPGFVLGQFIDDDEIAKNKDENGKVQIEVKPSGGDIETIVSWGDNKWKTMEEMFAGTYVKKLEATDKPNLSNVKSMRRLFYKANYFNGEIGHWDVSSINDMSEMFYDASEFDQPLNDWNVSNVTKMNDMFFNARLFDQPLDKWNTSSVTNMEGMFCYTSFDQPLNDWNTSKVTKMTSMFLLSDYNHPLNNWDVSNVTIMAGMFFSNEKFNQPLNNWNTRKVKNMFRMFEFATAFRQDISGWKVSKVKMYIDFASSSSIPCTMIPKKFVKAGCE